MTKQILITGEKGGCFARGTKISTPTGYILIEDIITGDEVMSFNSEGQSVIGLVTDTFYHEYDKVIRIEAWDTELLVTPNHWVLNEYNKFVEIGTLEVDDALITEENYPCPIMSITDEIPQETFNFTVDIHHTYIANGIKVHNKGGGKGGGGAQYAPTETPNNLFSTDILFLTTALGEGPLYRINPNGPIDIELNDGFIDDLIDDDGNEDAANFRSLTTNGTIHQAPLGIFGDRVVTPQSMSSTVRLKKGNLSSIPRAAVTLQNTSITGWDALSFRLRVNVLLQTTDKGDILDHTVTYKITLYDNTGTDIITSSEKVISGKTNTPYKTTNLIVIPDEKKDPLGYRFTVEKISDDSESSRFRDDISFEGWDEIEFDDMAYPRTALIGYAIRSNAEYAGTIPTFTSMVKGLVVKVPSNFNQPIIENGDIDWRYLEIADSGDSGYPTTGYYLQKSGTDVVLTDANPVLYEGVWDGTFVNAWTQNPVWIIYDLLTNTSYGLGISEDYIDKYNFYRAAVYCDACDITTGQYLGVDGYANSTYQHKARNTHTGVKDKLSGLNASIQIKERRFITNLIIASEASVISIVNQVTSTIRAVPTYYKGKIILNMDLPDELPIAVFNETNIVKDSFTIFGSKESDVISAIDVTFVDPTNHYKRETIRVEDPRALIDQNQIEKVDSVNLEGVDRRSQSMRFGQYSIAASKYLRRFATFATGSEASELPVGAIIAVQMKTQGVAYGFGGRITANSVVSEQNVYVEHFTSPAITASTFTANTLPLALRIIKGKDNRVDSYLLSNVLYDLSSTGNVEAGADFGRFNVIQKFNPHTKEYSTTNVAFTADTIPQVGDLWALGEVNPDNHYTATSDKLFKVTKIARDTDEEVTVTGVEYVSNVYTDSDTIINYTPTAYVDTFSQLVAPPEPILQIDSYPVRSSDGSVSVNLQVDSYTDTTGYPSAFQTNYELAKPDDYYYVTSSQVVDSGLQITSTSNIDDVVPNTAISIIGKNGFTSRLGVIPLLCNAYVGVDEVGGVSQNIEFQVPSLNSVFDDNFFKHVLATNDSSFNGLKGDDYASIPVKEKSNTSGLLNFVGYRSDLTKFSSNIVSYDLNTNTLKINNSLANDGTQLLTAVDSSPFYLEIAQILSTEHFSNNVVYLEGSKQTRIYNNTIPVSSGSFTQPLNNPARTLSDVRVFIDGLLHNPSEYTGTLSNSNIVVSNLSGSETDIRVEVDEYNVPIIEQGDNVALYSGNTYAIANTSYDSGDAYYNAHLTANHIYKVKFASPLTGNVSGTTAINISKDLLPGKIGNVTIGARTLTIDYPVDQGNFRLANNNVYQVALSSTFEALSLSSDKTIKDLNEGLHIVRAYNVNSNSRRSKTVSQSIIISTIPISRVEGLKLEETLYRDTTVGVSSRVTVVFDHIVAQEVTDYEVSYKLSGVDTDDDLTDSVTGFNLTTFNTVKLPATGVDSEGHMNFTINNLEGQVSGIPTKVIVQVTPLNKQITGTTSIIELDLLGKTAQPLNIKNLTGGQVGDTVNLLWDYYRNDAGEFRDLDLKEVVVRRVPGAVASSTYGTAFSTASSVAIISAGSTRKVVQIDSYGIHTYLAKTRDTSGNYSSDTVGVAVTTTAPENANVFKTWSEDTPTGNVFVGIPNDNYQNGIYESLANSDNGGFSYAADPYSGGVPSTPTENSNGTSTGLAVVIGTPTDLTTESNGIYQTSIRDVGRSLTGSIYVNVQASVATVDTYNDFRITIASGATGDPEALSATANILIDSNTGGAQGIGTLLGYSNANAAAVTYSTINRTLQSGGSLGNVYAIWNEGQHTGDVSNSNSYALIAGVVNANAIVLGETFYANGVATGGNTFANLTTSSGSYKLVNLEQFGDAAGIGTFEGSPTAVSSVIKIRTSDTDPNAWANGNTDISVFAASSVDDGFQVFSTGSRTFRYFQLLYEINNSNPSLYNYTIDSFNYYVTLDQKTFNDTYAYAPDSTGNQAVNYANVGFINNPQIAVSIVNPSNALAIPTHVIMSADQNESNIRLYYSSNATLVESGAMFTFIATGI